jgi:hypothetical protein
VLEIEQPEIPEVPEVPEAPPAPTFFDRLAKALQPVVDFFSVIARALIFSAVAVLVGLVLPKQTTLVRETIGEQPVLSGGFGLLSVGVFVAAIIVLALLSITVILIPLTISLIVLLSLAFTLGIVYGLIAVGGEFGRRIMIAAKQEWTTTLQTAVGGFSMAFLLGLLSYGLWGVIGGLLWTLVGAIGLGSVLLTRFGTQPYIPSDQRSAPSGKNKDGADQINDDAETLVMEAIELAEAPEEDIPEVSEDDPGEEPESE